jgi:hypothetical protein
MEKFSWKFGISWKALPQKSFSKRAFYGNFLNKNSLKLFVENELSKAPKKAIKIQRNSQKPTRAIPNMCMHKIK